MSWPLASHFSAMLQNPRVEKDERRQPRPWAGAFAVVYKGLDAGGNPFAVRVFTTESPERRERYEQISAYLKGRRLKCLVDFEYRDDSIRSAGDGKWYPMILMDWVSGDTLFKWARNQCLKGSTAALARTAERWVELVNELAEVSMAHGDLQHANVMVTGAGELKLVDYDCMCVPALVGRRNLEVGVEPYQHPGRNESTLLSLDLDNFSALVVYVALRALAATPQLWQKHIEQPGYDKLLFRSEDFRFPANSALYADLMQSPDNEVRKLTEKLFSLVRGPINQVPPLGQLADSFAKVEQLLKQSQWEKAVRLLNRRGHFQDAPKRLQPLIRQAYEYVCRKQAWEVYCKVPAKTSEENDRKLVECWNERLFAGYEPAERQRVRVAEARRRAALLDRLTYLIQQTGKTITLAGEQSIVEAASKLPQGYQYSMRARVEKARRRVSAVTRLQERLGDASSEAAIVAAWRAAVEAKCEPLLDPAWRARVELAERRAPLLKTLYDIPADLHQDKQDQQIINAWQEDLLCDCKEADRWRSRYEAAVGRKDALGRLKAAIESRDEAAILELVEEPSLADSGRLPAAWKKAIQKAQEKAGRFDDLLAAVRDGQRTAFYELFDARLIRRGAEQFEPYRSAMTEWTLSGMLELEPLGLDTATARPAISPARGPAGSYRVKWKWPQRRFADQFLLAVCHDQPADNVVPQDVPTYMRVLIDRADWQRDGRSRVIHTQPEWIGGCVAVWAVIDLGFRVFYSRPLVLGRLETDSSWKWRSWNPFSARGGESTDSHNEDQQQQ